LRRLGSALRHDLNSPLQATLWSFDLIERGCASHPDAEARAKVANSIDMGRRELARLQKAVRLFVACAAPLDEQPESFDLRDVVAEIEKMLGAESSLRDVQMVFEQQEEALPVRGVRHQVQQALLLLALEALDATAPGTEIVVSMSRETSHAEVDLRHLARPGTTADAMSELVQHVTGLVARAHGGEVKRSQSDTRRDISLRLACRSV
jgi:signal transduction histidine kinase